MKKQVQFSIDEGRRGETFPNVKAYLSGGAASFQTVTNILWAGADPDTVKSRIDRSVKVVRDAMNKYIRSDATKIRRGSLGGVEVNVSDDRDPGLMLTLYQMHYTPSLKPEDKKALYDVLVKLFGKGNVKAERI